MTKLSTRVETAEVGSRELDYAIGEAVGHIPKLKHIYRRGRYIGGEPVLLRTKKEFPGYTTSLDAAMQLVPKGYRLSGLAEYDTSMGGLASLWTCTLLPRNHAHLRTYAERVAAMGQSSATTPVLALCSAALKARGL